MAVAIIDAGLNAGDLDRDIVIQTATAVQTPSGDPVFDWDHATTRNVFAQWFPEGTREAWLAQQRLESFVSGVFRIYDLDPRPGPDDSRILFEGKTYDLKPWVEIKRGTALEIAAVARGE